MHAQKESSDGESAIVLRASHLAKNYGSFEAVKDVSLDVRVGEIFGLLGPNGAGKTTTVSMCTGLLRPSTGTVRIHGIDMAADPQAAKRMIGYVPDEPYVYEKLTAREFVGYMGELYGAREGLGARVEELLEYFGLTQAANNLIGGYSHGMKQKVGLCAMLVHDPLLLVLDEPTVGLDPKGARLLKNTLRSLSRRGRAVVFCTHIMEIAEDICDRIAILDGGRIIAEGSVDELRRQVKLDSNRPLEDIFLRLTGEEDEWSTIDALRR